METMFGSAARFSLVLAQAFPGVADDAVPEVMHRAATEHGFEVFEVVPAASAEDRVAVATAARSLDAALIFLAGLPLLRAGASLVGEQDDRLRAVATVKEIISQAADAGAEAVMITSGRPADGADHDEAVLRLIDSFTELAEFAAHRAPGVMIRLEPTDNDLHHRQLVGPTTLALSIVSGVRERGQTIDLNLDLSHLIELGETPRDSLTLAASACRHVHLANCAVAVGHPLRGDRHPPFGVPGTEVGLAELVGALGDLVDSGYFSGEPVSIIGLEVTPLARDDAWTTLGRAVAHLRSAARSCASRLSAT